MPVEVEQQGSNHHTKFKMPALGTSDECYSQDCESETVSDARPLYMENNMSLKKESPDIGNVDDLQSAFNKLEIITNSGDGDLPLKFDKLKIDSTCNDDSTCEEREPSALSDDGIKREHLEERSHKSDTEDSCGDDFDTPRGPTNGVQTSLYDQHQDVYINNSRCDDPSLYHCNKARRPNVSNNDLPPIEAFMNETSSLNTPVMSLIEGLPNEALSSFGDIGLQVDSLLLNDAMITVGLGSEIESPSEIPVTSDEKGSLVTDDKLLATFAEDGFIQSFLLGSDNTKIRKNSGGSSCSDPPPSPQDSGYDAESIYAASDAPSPGRPISDVLKDLRTGDESDSSCDTQNANAGYQFQPHQANFNFEQVPVYNTEMLFNAERNMVSQQPYRSIAPKTTKAPTHEDRTPIKPKRGRPPKKEQVNSLRSTPQIFNQNVLQNQPQFPGNHNFQMSGGIAVPQNMIGQFSTNNMVQKVQQPVTTQCNYVNIPNLGLPVDILNEDLDTPQDEDMEQMQKAVTCTAKCPLEDLITPDEDGDTAVHIAATRKTIYPLKAICCRLRREDQLESLINRKNELEHTPFADAVLSTNAPHGELLLQMGADPNIQFKRRVNSGLTSYLAPIHVAATLGSIPILQMFGKSQILDVNTLNSDGETALHIAIRGKQNYNLKIINLLLEMGADPGKQETKFGRTSLHYAVEKRDLALVDLICRHCQRQRVDILNKKNFSENTALHTAASHHFNESDKQLQIIQVLLKYGVDRDLRNHDHKQAKDVYRGNRDEIQHQLKGPTVKTMVSNPPTTCMYQTTVSSPTRGVMSQHQYQGGVSYQAQGSPYQPGSPYQGGTQYQAGSPYQAQASPYQQIGSPSYSRTGSPGNGGNYYVN